MLDGFPRVGRSRRLFRMASIEEDDRFIAELGLDGEGRGELLGLLADAGAGRDLDELLDGPFRPRPKRFASRFSDGSFPVLYTSLEAETAKAEFAHHLPSRMGNPRVPRVVYCSLFSCAFEGVEIDLRPMVGDWPDLVHDTDYAFCNRVGAEAKRLQLDGLVTRSVRRPEGSNLPVFSRKAVGRPSPEGGLAVEYDPGSRKVSVRDPDE